VAGFVDEAHGVEGTGVDGELGMLFGIAHLVHAVRKFAAGSHVGEDDVARVGEERRLEGIPLPRVLRYVEFHHENRSSKYVQRFMNRQEARPRPEPSVPYRGLMRVAGTSQVGGWNLVKR
jgi:hypothetical protein